MMFCPKCGSILMPKKVKNKTILACSCGYKSKEAPKAIKEKVKNNDKKLEIIEKEESVHPIVEEECPKCHHKKAYAWEIQTRAADEPATRFHKCVKCGHTWREYR